MNASSQQRKQAHTSWARKPEIMEPTITQNGALFAMQHRTATKKNYRQHHHRHIPNPTKTIFTLRTSVGEFVFRQTPLGCHLELILGNARWALGLYGTNEAAVRALKNGRTGFRIWDALERRTAATQIGTLSRWSKGEQTA
jgi:hypothetical protein